MGATMEITVETITRRRGVSRLALAVGRNHSHISRVLSGERKPGKDLARQLARLGVQVGIGEARRAAGGVRGDLSAQGARGETTGEETRR